MWFVFLYLLLFSAIAQLNMFHMEKRSRNTLIIIIIIIIIIITMQSQKIIVNIEGNEKR